MNRRLIHMTAAAALLAAPVLLAACGREPQPLPAVEPSPEAAVRSAAEKECAQLTNAQPEKLERMTPEMRTLVERDYARCVAEVAREDLGLRKSKPD